MAAVDHLGLTLTVITDLDGVIHEASENAHSFLGVSARSAVGRNLLLFFAEDRLAVLASIRRLTQLERVEGSARLKPRDRRPIPVRFCIVAAGPRGVSELVRWEILNVPPAAAISPKESASSL